MTGMAHLLSTLVVPSGGRWRFRGNIWRETWTVTARQEPRSPGGTMFTIYDAPDAFFLEHRRCGELEAIEHTDNRVDGVENEVLEGLHLTA
jgi:hypothetical protein